MAQMLDTLIARYCKASLLDRKQKVRARIDVGH
jgi:hypothetical protein